MAKSITSNFLSKRGGNCAPIKSTTTLPPSSLISIGIDGFDNLMITLPSPFSPLLKSMSSILADGAEENDISLSSAEYDFPVGLLSVTATPLPKFKITALPLTSTE